LGHPVIASACLEKITETHLMAEAFEKENLFLVSMVLDTRNKRKRIDARSDD
jgi:hypothetical protein